MSFFQPHKSLLLCFSPQSLLYSPNHLYWRGFPHYTIISADNGSCWHDRAGVGGGQCAPLYIRIHTLILLFLLCVPTKEGRPRLTVTNGGLVLQQITRRARTSQRWNTARSPPLSSFLSHRKGWAALFSFQLRLVPHNGCCHIWCNGTTSTYARSLCARVSASTL